MNRVFYINISKLIKRYICGKPQSQSLTDQIGKFKILFEYQRVIFSDWYKFLSTFIQICFKEEKHINFILNQEFNNFPNLSSEEENHNSKSLKLKRTLTQQDNSSPYKIRSKSLWENTKLRIQFKKMNVLPDYLEVVNKIEKNDLVKSINIEFEISQFIIKFLDYLIFQAKLFSKIEIYNESYYLLWYANKICINFEMSNVYKTLKIKNI